MSLRAATGSPAHTKMTSPGNTAALLMPTTDLDKLLVGWITENPPAQYAGCGFPLFIESHDWASVVVVGVECFDKPYLDVFEMHRIVTASGPSFLPVKDDH